MTPIYILAAIAVVVVVHYVKSNWRKWRYAKDPVFPDAPKRHGLYYGYFGCTKDQVTETKGHVNILCEVQFEPQNAIRHMLECGTDVMLALSCQLVDRPDANTKFTVRPDAESRLTDFFIALKLAGVLGQVKALTPIDEPNNTMASEAELAKAIFIIRQVAHKFPELDGYKLYMIYAADKPFICSEQCDWIGFDDYDMKGSVLNGKQYQDLKTSLRGGQKTILIPGGSYGQDPIPFINYAKANTEVAVVLGFLWADDEWGTVGAPGIRSNGTRDKYINAGKSVI